MANISLTRVHKFNFKLVELYAGNECLWNINDPRFLDGEGQKLVWKQIAQQLDEKGRITADFCRRRIQELRHWENHYRLRQLRCAKRCVKFYTPLADWRHRACERRLVKLSTTSITRDVVMSLGLSRERPKELLPENCYSHVFSFLNKIFQPE